MASVDGLLEDAIEGHEHVRIHDTFPALLDEQANRLMAEGECGGSA